MHTDRDELDRLRGRGTTDGGCVVCGAPIAPARIRCDDCPAPPRPRDYIEARKRLRARLTEVGDQ